MRTVALAFRQVKYTNKAYWRNPAAAFFTFAFPLMFLVIFTALFGNGTMPIGGVMVRRSTYFVASMAGFSLISACYTNIAISITFQRDQGILKRLRGTPLPSSSYMAGRVLHATGVAFVLVVICSVFGALFYDAQIPTGADLLRTAVAVGVGAAAFAALALALTAIIPNADAAPPIVNATILPLLFLSGVFFPLSDTSPAWITIVAKIFPVYHFLQPLSAGYLGTAYSWSDIAILALWGVVGLVLAARFFSWEPRR